MIVNSPRYVPHLVSPFSCFDRTHNMSLANAAILMLMEAVDMSEVKITNRMGPTTLLYGTAEFIGFREETSFDTLTKKFPTDK